MLIRFLNIQRFFAGLFCLAVFGASLPIFAQSDAEKRVEIFEQVWNTINEKYYDANFNGADWAAIGRKYRARLKKISGDKSFYILLDRMAGELRDSHTRVYSPEQREQRKKQTRASVGISIKKIENAVLISSVAPDSEAERLGIKAGMKVLSVNGEPVKSAIKKSRRAVGISSSKQATEMRVFSKILAGEPGNDLKISLLNNGGEKRDFVLKRSPVSAAPKISARVLSDKIAYLKFDNFDESLEMKINEHLKSFNDAKALIIDLRGNAGGDGETGLRFAGKFFDEKTTIAKIVTRTGKPPVEGMPMTLETENDGERTFTKPLVVLIDERTASTAELVTNALQETGRARVFGTNSCGCVLAFLDYKPLKYGGDLTLSEFGFLTPKNKCIEGEGIAPDKIIPLKIEDLKTNRDAALEEAEKFLINLTGK